MDRSAHREEGRQGDVHLSRRAITKGAPKVSLLRHFSAFLSVHEGSVLLQTAVWCSTKRIRRPEVASNAIATPLHAHN
jgi:hypothetical protein